MTGEIPARPSVEQQLDRLAREWSQVRVRRPEDQHNGWVVDNLCEAGTPPADADPIEIHASTLSDALAEALATDRPCEADPNWMEADG